MKDDRSPDPRSGDMPHSVVFDPIIPPVERPMCTLCGELMWLTRIEPDKPDHDRRTFECSECENIETVVVNFK